MTLSKSRLSASFEMVIAAALWGFGFIAAVWALEALTFVQITFARFAAAALIGIGIVMFARGRAAWRENLRWSFWPAVLIAGTLLFQTWGLNYTTATKSGFITTLYVIFVPLMDAARRRQSLPREIWLCVAVALFGTFLIVGGNLYGFNFGDFLTLICAVLAALQIVVVGEVSSRVRTPFVFNIVQSMWAALVCAPLLALEPLTPRLALMGEWPPTVWIGLTSLALGSTVIAFYLQVRAQARLSATVSSLLFLLESPFAMFFAILFLKELLSVHEAIGAALIFLSAGAATLLEARRKKF